MNNFADRSLPPDLSSPLEVNISEIHYQELFDAARNGVLLLDAETRQITDANPFLCELLGYPRAELLGKQLWQLGLFSGQQQRQSAFRELQEKGHIRYEDLLLEAKGGGRREVEFVCQRYQSGSQQSIVCIVRDMTERWRLQKDKYFLAAIVESLADSVVTVDFETIITSWNKAAEQLYGYTAEEALGKPLTMLSLTTNLQEMLAKIAQVKQGNKVETYDAERVRKDGHHIFLSITLSPVRDAQERIIGVSTVARDITRQKRVKAAFDQNEEQMRTMVESVTDYAIFTLDPDGRIATWNTGAERTFGYSPEEAIGQPASLLFTPEDRERGAPEEEMREAREAGRAEDERWHLRKDGTHFYASGVMSPLGDDSLTGYVKVARDLTKRKQMENDLHHARTGLEARVKERTSELNSALTQLQSEMTKREQIEAERHRFLERIVQGQEEERRRISRDLHDHLGQQLTALRLAIETVPGQSASHLENLKAMIKQLDEEVDFLAWELRPAALDQFGLVSALKTYVEEWTQHFKIQGDFDTSGLSEDRFAPEIEINLYRIAQEALNNIAKHAQAANVGVVLQKQNEIIILAIEDDGVGFEPKQVSAPDSADKGLGLIGMRERAALIEGTLEIESKPGEGTTILARVPVRSE